MTRILQTRDVPPPRMRSREEMDEVYRQIVISSPQEGPRLVEVHKTLIAKLDEMIAASRRRRTR